MPPVSKPPLRAIAILVEEPSAGAFNWVLSERSGRQWSPLQTAPEPAATYREAMAQGLLALQAMVPDLDIGPREEEKEAASPNAPNAPNAPDEDTEAAPPPPRRGALFGFGPAR